MRFIVTGRVLPERGDISFSSIEWRLPTDGLVAAHCSSSQLTMVVDLASVSDPATAYITAEHFALIIVGALGFSLGSGYSVELVQVTDQEAKPHVFGVRPTDLTTTRTLGFDPHTPVLNRAFQLSNRDLFFRLAVRDYLRAITDTTDCATYCYRAIESIKSAFVFKTGKDNWQAMHAALGTDRDTIDSSVKRYADPVRHGNWVNAAPTDGPARWRMLQLTREVLSKYLDYEQPAT
ncbi:hypothetical protein ACVNIS_06395 [Sphaerotilaceae bacterium SBD11-9]